MLGMITGQLRRHSVETSRLTVKASADADFRAAYDILVRPAGARTGRVQTPPVLLVPDARSQLCSSVLSLAVILATNEIVRYGQKAPGA